MPESQKVAIGIDIGGTYIKGGVVTDTGLAVEKQSVPTEADKGLDTLVGNIAELVDSLRKSNGIGDERFIGVGVGVPGVTTAEGVIVIAPNLDLHNVPFRKVLSERLGVRTEIDNDANVAALAEARVGIGAGCQELFLMTLGTGIGGGIVLNGQIYHGASHSAGEIGHMCVEPEGPVCGCGLRGCLETLASGPAMVRDFTQRLGDGPKPFDPITPEAICRGAEEGDELCLQSIEHFAYYIGIAAANIINVYSPEYIAIGGGISAAGITLFRPILEATRKRTLEGMFEHTQIRAATLGNDAGFLGAAHLVL